MKENIMIRRSIALGVLLILLLLNPWVALAVPGSQGTVSHLVRRGETLSGIAARYGVSTFAIMRANGITNPNRIYVGQRLKIPTSSWTSKTDSVSSVASTSSISRTTGTCGTHTVRRGETLSSIAYRYGVTVTSIQQANGLRSSRIYTGQRLTIPCTRIILPTIIEGRTSTSSQGCTLVNGKYKVRAGDTLFQIALRCGSSVSAIRAANGLSSLSSIRVGQWLVIPGHSNYVPTPALQWRYGEARPTPTPTPTPAPTPVAPIWTWSPTPTPTPTAVLRFQSAIPTPTP